MAKILLNQKNFFYNLDEVVKKVGKKEKIAIVLKSNAYGHGILQIAKMSKKYGLKRAVVKNIKEAKLIKKYFKHILVLGDIPKKSLKHNFEISINNINDIKKLAKNTKIAIKVNTSMNRNGIEEFQLKNCFKKAIKNNLIISSVYTHFRSADINNNDFLIQKNIFAKIKQEAKELQNKLNLPQIKFHSHNSMSVFRNDNFDDDYCRVGIASFGYLGNEKSLKVPKLKPILSLWGDKISSRVLKKGESVGYGATFTTTKDIDISTYDIGYADGFSRINPKVDFFTKDGSKLLGIVSMNFISIQSTKDEICIFDDVGILQKIHKTICYEILTNLKPDIKKFII
jgi:alanine racemase